MSLTVSGEQCRALAHRSVLQPRNIIRASRLLRLSIRSLMIVFVDRFFFNRRISPFSSDLGLCWDVLGKAAYLKLSPFLGRLVSF